MPSARDTEPEPYVIPLSLDGREALSFSPEELQGWASYHSDAVEEMNAYVFIRFGPQGQGSAEHSPFEIRELRVVVATETAGFGSPLLREIPATRIEAAVNQPDHREVLKRLVMPGFVVADSVPIAGVRWTLRPNPIKPRRPQLKINDPGGYRKPDEFYRQVASRYLWLAAVSPRPAQELAAANDVPVATVHRWIREAKARGVLLLPTHRG
jgi:hypothetical protein